MHAVAFRAPPDQNNLPIARSLTSSPLQCSLLPRNSHRLQGLGHGYLWGRVGEGVHFSLPQHPSSSLHFAHVGVSQAHTSAGIGDSICDKKVTHSLWEPPNFLFDIVLGNHLPWPQASCAEGGVAGCSDPLLSTGTCSCPALTLSPPVPIKALT